MKILTSMVLMAAVLQPVAALGETEWMGDARQWSVGFAGERPAYCRLLWNSELGKTVEFRQSATETFWLVTKDTWDIPAGTTTEVTLTDRSMTKVVAAEFFDKTTLRLWPPASKGSGGLKKIIKNSFAGTPDVQLTFAGDEGDWTLPLSRVDQLYPTFAQCLKRLGAGEKAKQDSATSKPF
ncbi:MULTISPECIES: hypothetical protein [unclassified Rhizobium]|uniref:hypothetical protein n=1 Tax=unclassified Rhizobium TaxID=2613769 RepID=UPI001A983B53|nr:MULTISPECIES: hypothetical protein [unclassified Rhizobium]MBX5155900.1 hypothetical protein [Rhizobium sp. NZLR8]MBX5164227.1 hypothetical protein [Rhizobium sp. NZLR4b]MBX5169779.1 hypothetical protein [Rhizobium sp. NZLR1b]MBX5192759.1 hypothetical protein [Rhizobium sp. NZLR3b]MBX5201780.1 hypothetical protein [Rhizobium sp. NZLR1]